MGKLILVLGENNSGKSKFSEEMISKIEGNRYYIATMIPATDENYDRIKKHKKQREGLGFTTLELPYSLDVGMIDCNSVVLLEDVTNLLANNIFDKNKTADDVFYDIISLKEKCKLLVAVGISDLDENGYDKETEMYINGINELNQKLTDEAFTVIKMENKNPIYLKGEEYAIN